MQMPFFEPAPLTRRQLVLAFTLGALAGAARAQNFPSRTVRIVLPQPPGGAADRLARLMGERLQAMWKQPVIVDYKPGGGVINGTLATVRAAPDGYTLGLLGSSLSINSVQRKDLPYELKDMQPIARVAYLPMALLATASFPANDVKGLIELAKAKPAQQFSFGSNGIGTSAQVSGEMLNHMAGIELQHVPYNGASKMYTDMIGGQIPLGFSVLSSAESFVKSGQLKVLGVTSLQRSVLYSAVPAIAETLPGFEVVNWSGFVTPAGLPPELVRRLSADILQMLKAPDIARQFGETGFELAPLGPEEFGAFIDKEIRRFASIIRPITTRLN